MDGTAEGRTRTFRLILGWIPLDATLQLVRDFCSKAEVDRIPEIKSRWERAVVKYASLAEREPVSEVPAATTDLGAELNDEVEAVKNDPLFKKNFGSSKYEFRMVELEKLITFQLHVYPEHSRMLGATLGDRPDARSLFDFCLKMHKEDGRLDIERKKGAYTFNSDTDNFKFLGTAVRDAESSDLAYLPGGIPYKVIMVFVGTGSQRMNTIYSGGRMFMSNGIHRAFALLSAGIKYAPVIVQGVEADKFELPPNLYGVRGEFAICQPRPPLMKDFFDPDLTIDLESKTAKRSIRVNVSSDTMLPT